ncbi:MAG: hypothetical protein AABW50_04100 [Nanoarchaeota archaeon]
MSQDAIQTKEHIVNFLKRSGPSLPVHIAKNANMSMLFTSAFLSELVSDKKIKMSYLRVGSSPVYFIPGQEPSLDKFAEHLKSKEKDAYIMIKEKKFIHDHSQDPAIRLALRSIKDFSISFENAGELYWRYFTTDPSEFTAPKDEIKQIEEKPKEEIIMQPIEKEENLEILAPIIQEEPKPKKKPKEKTEPIKPKKQSKKKTEKKDDKFFDKIKGHLEKRGIEIIGIEGVGKSELILKIKEKKEEKLLFAYKKKRITDEDLMKAYKKSSDFNLAYKVLSLGETPKKLSGLIEAARSLENIERIE